jgi:type IV pilus assembly protein PilO
MKIDFSKKQWSIFISLFAAGLIMAAVLNFFLIQPMEERINYKEEELAIQLKLQEAIETKVNNINENDTADSTTLQKKIPVEPLTERLILDLEKAELVSGSTIQSINFERTDGPLAAQGNEESDGVPVKETQLPPLLKRLQMTMVVESPSYFEMEEFLEEIESLQRIVEINRLYFEGEEELKESIEGYSQDMVTFELTASAFFIPELDDLKDGVPAIQSPSPSLKKDPFPQFPNE